MLGTSRLKRPSHSTVVSYLALFVALGGTTAYAANTIGSHDVVDGSLRSRDIKNGNVKNVDIGRNQVTTSKIKAGNVGTTDLADGAIVTGKILDGTVFTDDLADGAVNSAKVSNESLTSADLATDSVNATEIADNSITSAKVTNDTLTTADVAGADVNGGGISVPAGYAPNGRCRQLDASVGGAKAGEAVVLSGQAAIQDGVVIYGQRVPSDNHVTFDICNFSGTTQAAIADMPIRVITFG
jgi:hypothetical protein